MKKCQFILATLLGMVSISVMAAEPQMDIGGAIEFEAVRDDDGNNDLSLATFELDITATLSERVAAEVVLHQEDGEPFGVDIATISTDLGSGLTLFTGKSYIPFGTFESNMISDPLPLQLVETNGAVVQLYDASSPLSGSIYIFSGTREEEQENGGDQEAEQENGGTQEAEQENGGDQKKEAKRRDSYGLSLDYDAGTLTFHVGYLNNIGDTDPIASSIDRSGSDVAGNAFSVNYNTGTFAFIYELINARGEIAIEDGGSAKPRASNVEMAIINGNTLFAIGYQKTNDDTSTFLNLPEKRTLLTASTALTPGALFSIEYARDRDDAGDATTTTLQLAVDF